MPARERPFGRRRSRLALLATAAALFLLTSDSVAAGLSDVRGVDELKRWFNTERGHARVILLLSPT